MEDIKNLPNSELLSQMNILSQNHEQVKREVLMLHELLEKIENEYILLSEELKTRVS